MYVCLCRAVTDRAVRGAIAGGARTFGDVARASEAGTVCGQCRPAVERLLEEALREERRPVQGGTVLRLRPR